MPFWGVVMGVVNIIMGVIRGRFHQLPVGVAMVPEGSLKKLEPMYFFFFFFFFFESASFSGSKINIKNKTVRLKNIYW